MEFNLTKKNIVFIALISLSILIWTYFLNSTDLIITEMLNLGEMGNIILKLNTSNFFLFLVSFPLTIALIVIQTKLEEKRINSFIVSIGGSLIGLSLALILFSNMQEYLLIGIFYLIGIILTTELINVKKLELKKYVSFRLLGTGNQKTTTIIALGLFLFVAMTVYDNKEMYSEQIDNQLLELAGGNDAKDQLSDYAADLLIESHKQTAKQITSLPTFDALGTSIDPNAVAFHTGLLELTDSVNSPEYREQIKQEIAKQSDVSDDQLKDVLTTVKQQMPLFGIMTDLLWLIEGFAFFSAFLLISNTIFYILTAIYGLIIEQIFKIAVK